MAEQVQGMDASAQDWQATLVRLRAHNPADFRAKLRQEAITEGDATVRLARRMQGVIGGLLLTSGGAAWMMASGNAKFPPLWGFAVMVIALIALAAIGAFGLIGGCLRPMREVRQEVEAHFVGPIRELEGSELIELGSLVDQCLALKSVVRDWLTAGPPTLRELELLRVANAVWVSQQRLEAVYASVGASTVDEAAG